MCWTAFAGALAGLALGMKVTAAPAIALLGACLLLRKRGLPLVLTFASLAAVAGSFWFAKNWLLTGNPLFPGEAGPFAGPFTNAEQAQGRLITQIIAHGASPSFWPSVIRGYLDWPFGPAVFALLGFGSALLAERRARACRVAGVQQVRLPRVSMYEEQIAHFCEAVGSCAPFRIRSDEARAVIDTIDRCYGRCKAAAT